MFSFKTIELKNNKYFAKINGEESEIISILHKGKYKSTISLPKINYIENKDNFIKPSKTDIEQLGYLTSKNSSLQLINSDIRIDSSFILENSSYVENLDLIKSLLEAAADKKKGLIVFENNGEIQKHLKNKNIEFDLYNKVNLKIKYSDLNERILLDVLNLSNREQSVIASFINFKQLNKGNADLNIPVLDGSNWLYDLFIVEPSTLAQQFRVNEFSVKQLKTSMLQLNMNGMMSQEYSTINEIINRANDGNIVVIDIKEQDKKLIKATLSNKSQLNITVIDNVYHKFDNIQYILYDCNLFERTTKDFKSFILNKHSFYLKEELIEMQYYLNELKFLDFEYLIIKENSFPLIVTNEDYKPLNVMKKIKVDTTSTLNFF